MLLQWYCKSVIAKISENVSITKVGSDAYIFFKKEAIHLQRGYNGNVLPRTKCMEVKISRW